MPTDFFGRVMVVFNRYGMSMLQGAGVSLKIALVGTLVGCIIGFAVGIVQTIPSERGDNPVKRAVLWAVKLILNAYVEFFRGTPMMAQAMFIYYGLFPLLNVNMRSELICLCGAPPISFFPSIQALTWLRQSAAESFPLTRARQREQRPSA